MSNIEQLPYVIELLDDSSPAIRDAVLKELSSYGSDLSCVLDQMVSPPDSLVRQKIQDLLAGYTPSDQQKIWLGWLNEKCEYQQLEKAMIFLSEYQNGFQKKYDISIILSHISDDFLSECNDVNLFELAHYLFQSDRMKGVSEDYYNPQNSDLGYALTEQKGLPVTLAIILMLVGYRVGVEIHGLNVPGHFVASGMWKNKSYVIDCYNEGEIISEDSFINVHSSGSVKANSMRFKANTNVIVSRVLKNISIAYEKTGDTSRSRQAVDFLKELCQR
ncbi:MAG: hypothetical protein COA79_25475 [Planctomycetota bacterium]|nr:MAG: hypothetical protein COA79_25475 [Planctomycetota bacterium]